MCVLASGYVEMNYLMLQILFCFYLFLLKLDTCSFSAAALTFVSPGRKDIFLHSLFL